MSIGFVCCLQTLAEAIYLVFCKEHSLLIKLQVQCWQCHLSHCALIKQCVNYGHRDTYITSYMQWSWETSKGTDWTHPRFLWRWWRTTRFRRLSCNTHTSV